MRPRINGKPKRAESGSGQVRPEAGCPRIWPVPAKRSYCPPARQGGAYAELVGDIQG